MTSRSLGKAVLELSTDDSKYKAGLDESKRSFDGLKTATVAGLATMGVAFAGVAGFASKLAMDFDAGMREVNTLVNLSEQELSDLNTSVLRLSQDLGVDAVQSSKALYEAISAGVPAENALTFLEIATKAAIGGVTDTATVVDGLSTVLNAFHLPASQAQLIADQMFTTVKLGKVTMDELAGTLSNVAGIAASVGVDFGSVAAAIATLTKQGIPAAQATTQLRQVMVEMIKPGKDLAKAIEATGFESGKALIAAHGLQGGLQILREAVEKSGGSFDTTFGSVEALSAALGLTGTNAEMASSDLEAVANAAGASEKAFEEMNKSSLRQFETLKFRLLGVLTELGMVLLPLINKGMDTLGPPMTNVLRLLTAFADTTSRIMQSRADFAEYHDILGEFFGMDMDPFIGAIISAKDAIQNADFAIAKFMYLLEPNLSTALANIQAVFERVWPGISNTIQIAWQIIETVISTVWAIVSGLITAGLAVLAGDWSGAWEAMKGVVSAAWDGIHELIRLGILSLVNVLGLVIGVLHSIGTGIVDGIRDGISAAWGALSGWFTDRINDLLSSAKSVLGISSPSKAFMEVGEAIGEGIAVGVENSIPTVQAAMFDLRDVWQSQLGAMERDTEQYNKKLQVLADERLAMVNHEATVTLRLAQRDERAGLKGKARKAATEQRMAEETAIMKEALAAMGVRTFYAEVGNRERLDDILTKEQKLRFNQMVPGGYFPHLPTSGILSGGNRAVNVTLVNHGVMGVNDAETWVTKTVQDAARRGTSD